MGVERGKGFGLLRRPGADHLDRPAGQKEDRARFEKAKDQSNPNNWAAANLAASSAFREVAVL
jgi:hypothetical protein